jgi:hypothetical protein
MQEKTGLPSIDVGLETAAREGTNFVIKALRGAINLDAKENRLLLQAATSAVGSYTRNRATASAMQQTRLVQVRMLTDPDIGGTVAGLLGSGDGD